MKKLALGALLTGIVACGGGDDKPIVLPDTPTVDTMVTCSPLTQAGCNAGEKCAWVELQEMPQLGQIACVPDGTVAAGGACTYGAAGPAGYSNCAAGTECVAGTCKTICDHQGGAPMCDSNHSCSRYESLFESGDVTVAGVCDPKCDPLTQELLAGTNTAACGSPDPAAPNAGCFTFTGLDYTCAPVGPSTLTLTDGMPARANPSGQAYVNGCAPGFLPFFGEMTGSNTVICAGMCAPLKTDSTLVANAIGSPTVAAKLPTKAAPAAGDAVCVTNKKGSKPVTFGQNCLYMWQFNIENMMLPDSPYNDGLGICFDYSRYTYDHDETTTTPNIGVPSCADLPPKGGTPHPTHNMTAEQWIGCYSSVDSQFTAGPRKVHPFARDLRIGKPGEGTLVRHSIR